MKVYFKGIKTRESKIFDFIEFLSNLSHENRWIYKGLKVEIDPTIDYNNCNVLIRWLDVEEGFNDRIIYYSVADFEKDFKLANA